MKKIIFTKPISPSESKMPPPTRRKVDLNIEIDILTAGSAAEVVNSILEFLLYQRNQIPFAFKTFKYYVGKWLNEQDDKTTIRSFQLSRQRDQAVKTKEAIIAMQELISKSFESNSINRLRFLFGATTLTPKEAYTIHIPTEAIKQHHHHQHHRLSHEHLSQALLTLVTSKDLYTLFSSNLFPTNLYLEFETLNGMCSSSQGAAGNTSEVSSKEICQLPASCKDVHLHLLHTPSLQCDSKELQCCGELQIFDDMLQLNINQDDASTVCRETLEPSYSVTNCSPVWWEADIIVRGFKEKSVSGASIWGK